MTRTWSDSAESIRSRVSQGTVDPATFRTALMSVPGLERDAWLNSVLSLDDVPDDGPELPPGCVPYLPCPVDALVRAVDTARIDENDIFVDIGSGVGRSAVLVHLLTGAATIGIEIQHELVVAARALTQRLNVSRCSAIHGEAASLTGYMMIGTVFFLYCPFSGSRLAKVLDDLEAIARTRRIRVCSVDLPLPTRSWLAPVPSSAAQVSVYESTHHPDGEVSRR